MPEFNISSQERLVQASVRQRQETYYLVTEDNLNSLKSKSLLADLFLFIASLTWGAYLSVIATINSIPETADKKNPTYEILIKLKTLENGFLIIGVVFSILTILMFVQSFNHMKKLKTGHEIDISGN